MKAVRSKLGFSAAIYHIWGHRMLLSSKVWLELGSDCGFHQKAN